MSNSIIEVKKLTKKFNSTAAVDHISFDVNEGEIFGFLGPNGAGKSTTIGMLCTLVRPTEGDAIINGFNIVSDRDEVRKSIGLVFQDPSLDDQLTAEENLRFHAELYGIAKDQYQSRFEEVLKLVDLFDRKDHIVKTFSGGMKRRLEIARGLIHYPKVLFLDEPTIGLDPQTRAYLWEYILKLKTEHRMSIFMTTHYMNEAEYCDRIAVIDHGKIIALDTPNNIKRMVSEDKIFIKSKVKGKLKKELEMKYGKEIKEEHEMLEIEVPEGEKALPALCIQFTGEIESIELRKPTLEDVFLKLTGRKIREKEATAVDQMRSHFRGPR